MSTRSVPTTTLPIFLRDPAKGEQIAVALDDAAKTLIDDLGQGGATPMIEAAIRAQAQIYIDAAAATRRFVGRGARDDNAAV